MTHWLAVGQILAKTTVHYTPPFEVRRPREPRERWAYTVAFHIYITKEAITIVLHTSTYEKQPASI